MPHKLIKDVDEDIWRKFVASCKLKDTKVGEELGKILKDYIDKNLRRLLK